MEWWFPGATGKGNAELPINQRKVSVENDIFRKSENSFLNAGEVNISLEKGYV